MHALFDLLLLIPAAALIACVVWLHWRALHDGAIQDVVLFLTGISIVWYIFCRWDRAKRPILGIVGASVLLAVVAGVARTAGAAAQEPSPEELAAEIQPLILQEWKNSSGLEKAIIRNVSLVARGGGHYSGFIEATLDGQPERLLLDVVLDRDTMRWEVKPE
jgi:hypothetical protein